MRITGTMRMIVLGILLALGIGMSTIAAIAYNGWLEVGADTPHYPLVVNAIAWVRERAIARQLLDITPPKDLESKERVRLGAGNYDAMCASCHLRPGLANSEIRQGLYPQPPSLTAKPENGEANPERRFWIIKHGIKASGKPAWSKGGITDEDIWNLVAFIDRLPAMTANQYRGLVDGGPGHMHGGEPAHESMHDGHAKQPPSTSLHNHVDEKGDRH